jgi:Rrf2 family protein
MSDAVSLGLHAMGVLASAPQERVSTPVIAELLGVSAAHLSKVLQRLEQSGLVEALRGPRGGFKLAKPAGGISLKDICEAVEGRYEVTRCPFRIPACNGNGTLGEEFMKLGRNLLELLERTRLSEWRMAAGVRRRTDRLHDRRDPSGSAGRRKQAVARSRRG